MFVYNEARAAVQETQMHQMAGFIFNRLMNLRYITIPGVRRMQNVVAIFLSLVTPNLSPVLNQTTENSPILVNIRGAFCN